MTSFLSLVSKEIPRSFFVVKSREKDHREFQFFKKKKRRYIYNKIFDFVLLLYIRIFKNYLASKDCKSYNRDDNSKIFHQTIFKFLKKFFSCESFHNEFIFGHFKRTKSLKIFKLLIFVSLKFLSLIMDTRVICTRVAIDSNPISLKSPF